MRFRTLIHELTYLLTSLLSLFISSFDVPLERWTNTIYIILMNCR